MGSWILSLAAAKRGVLAVPMAAVSIASTESEPAPPRVAKAARKSQFTTALHEPVVVLDRKIVVEVTGIVPVMTGKGFNVYSIVVRDQLDPYFSVTLLKRQVCSPA